MKNIIIAASLAASLLSSTVFASANAKEGDVNLTIKAQGLQKESRAIVSKKRGYGGEVEVGYFVANNVAVVLGGGFNRFQALTLDNTVSPVIKGPKLSYIPIHLGVQYHFANPNGFNPYLGGGYQYVHGKYKILHTNATVAKKHIHGGYVEAGVNFHASDDVALNVALKKVFTKKAAIYSDNALSPSISTSKIKYNPLILSVGATFSISQN